MVWRLETSGHKLKTPEERAWLESRLRERALQIEDKIVQRALSERLQGSPLDAVHQNRSGGAGRASGRARDAHQLAEKSGAATQIDRCYLSEEVI